MAELETKDKNFNGLVKQLTWFIAFVMAVVAVTLTVTRYIKSEIRDEVKSSIQASVAEILYEVKDFKSVKVLVNDHDKVISLLSYRIGAAEDKLSIPSINKNIRIEELNGRDTRKKEKDLDDNS